MSKWVKREDGWFCGVFEGLGYKTGLNPNIFRFMWLLSLMLFGSGLFFYLLLVLVLPKQHELYYYEAPKFLGVCYDLSYRLNVELSLVRLIVLGSFFLSGGLTFLVYCFMWLVLPERLYFKEY